MRKQLLTGLVTSMFLLGGVVGASANLLINGSFEDPIVLAHGGQWEQFNTVNGWGNAEVTEIQTKSLFGDAADGNQYVELDSITGNNLNHWLVQTFNTEIGKEYIFSFAYSPREGVLDNTLNAGVASYKSQAGDWLTSDTLFADGSNMTGTNWTYHTYSFIADWTSATVAFQDGGIDDSYGTFIDAVSVTAAPVPEPSTMLLFGTGLVGLVGLARRKKK